MRGRIVPGYATIDHDAGHSVLARGGQRRPRARLPVHPPTQPWRPPARHHRHRVPDRPELHRTRRIRATGSSASAMTIDEIHDDGRGLRRRRAPRARGGARRRRAARRERLSDHPVPQLGDQRPQGRLRRIAREPRPLRPRHRPRHPQARRQRLPPADEDQRARALRRAGASSTWGRPATRSRNRSRCASGSSRRASTRCTSRRGGFFPHPRNPAGIDLPVERARRRHTTR